MQTLLKQIIALAEQAGAAILEHYRVPTVTHLKADASPLTQADLAAEQIIARGLRALTPDYPILSEENAIVPFSERSKWSRYWLVDPLDGTRDFLAHNDEFTVNIALIEQGRPILGVVYAPALATCYYAADGLGAFKLTNNSEPLLLKTRPLSPSVPIKITVSRQHADARTQIFLQQFPNAEIITCGSALKFCLVAAGVADLYPRLGPTSEWDTAAAQCVLEQAGGEVLTRQGNKLNYNQKGSLLNSEFFAVGDVRFVKTKFANVRFD